MSKNVFLLALIAMGCTSCNMTSMINRSTDSINRNRWAIEKSTDTIRNNAELVGESTKAIEENNQLIRKMSH